MKSLFAPASGLVAPWPLALAGLVLLSACATPWKHEATGNRTWWQGELTLESLPAGAEASTEAEGRAGRPQPGQSQPLSLMIWTQGMLAHYGASTPWLYGLRALSGTAVTEGSGFRGHLGDAFATPAGEGFSGQARLVGGRWVLEGRLAWAGRGRARFRVERLEGEPAAGPEPAAPEAAGRDSPGVPLFARRDWTPPPAPADPAAWRAGWRALMSRGLAELESRAAWGVLDGPAWAGWTERWQAWREDFSDLAEPVPPAWDDPDLGPAAARVAARLRAQGLNPAPWLAAD